MTKEQAINFLSNTKVYVKDKSREIQEKLFSLGIYWSSSLATVQHKNAPFLYIGMGDDILRISQGSNVDTFYGHKYDEITPEDILNITIDEPKYRPFKDVEECWQEMLKHQPFGWLKSKELSSYSSIGTVGKGNGKGLIIRSTDECHRDCMDYIYGNYTFADGTPFGIKED